MARGTSSLEIQGAAPYKAPGSEMSAAQLEVYDQPLAFGQNGSSLHVIPQGTSEG